MRENAPRLEHNYNVNDQILIKLDANERKGQHGIGNPPTRGSYTIKKVYNNGTIRITKGNYEETASIRKVKPFRS